MTRQPKYENSLFLIVVALSAWVLPGGGHLLIKEYRRAMIIFVTITLTFVAGLYAGSIGVVDTVGGRVWYFGQILASPAVGIIAYVTETTVNAAGQKVYVSYGNPASIGQIYTTIAGLLNLLCIISAVYMTYSGRGEIIGEEEKTGGRKLI